MPVPRQLLRRLKPTPSPVGGLAPRYYTFWSINGPLDQSRLNRQLEDFKAAGLHGVVFHPRFYPGIPPYMSAEYLRFTEDTILAAKKIGLRFWLYDENGWPTGTGDGQVMAKYPDSGAMRLDLYPTASADSIGSFSVDADNRIVAAGTPGAKTWYMTPRKINYVDSLDPVVLGHFLELIHERYRAGLSKEAWDYVEAVFFDEPESGMIKDPFPEQAGIAWSRIMPDKLREKFGANYLEKIPLLFARGEGYQEARATYWELVSDVLIGGFFTPYFDWCKKHGKQLIGHIKGEEHPLFQLPMAGSCHRIFRHLSMPGIDALERYPSLDFFPRQASSVARQFGDGRCMVECFGGAGWGASPEDLERYLLWLGRNGITDYVFHLSQYRLDTPAITDWPPSEPLHLSWREAFPAVLERVSRELTARPPGARDTLVVAPYRGLMAEYEPWELLQTNGHNASFSPDTPATRTNNAFLAKLAELTAAGILYDVTDERTLEEDGCVENGQVRLGQVTYPHLFVDPGAQLRGEWPASSRGQSRRTAVPPVAVPAPTKPALPLTWALPAFPENAWLIEPAPTATERTYVGTFATAFAPGEAADLFFHFADDLVDATLDGKPLKLETIYDGVIARPGPLGTGEHKLRLRTARSVPGKPFVWLKGAFTVRSRTPFTPGPNRTQRTAGPFVAEVKAPPASVELTEGGFPFLQQPLVAETTITLAAPARALRFGGIKGDAIRVAVDGQAAGWIWGPDWELTLPAPLIAGSHRLRLELVPSTYNHFGPHHYYNGDWHVVSPGQVVGDKNFADAPDAANFTHIPEWHFKPLRLPTAVSVVA